MSAVWRAYLEWKVAAGPLADFVLPTPFLAESGSASPDASASQTPVPRHPLAPRLASGLVKREAGGRERGAGEVAAGLTIVFLEATPRLALAAAVQLRRHGWRIAPAFGRWPITGAVLPSLALGPWLRGALGERGSGSGEEREYAGALCVLLDAERRRPVPASALRRRFDNRYDYGSQVLPPPARLRAWGVTQVLWVGPAASLGPDLRHYVDGLVSAGFPVELVRHADLCDTSVPSSPGASVAHRAATSHSA